MLIDIKQNELDTAEERLLNSVFGSTTIDSKTQWFLNFFNIDINEVIQNFENFIKPFMLENGTIDSGLLKNVLRSKHPMLGAMVPTSNFRLVDVADDLSQVVNILFKGMKQ